MNSPGRIAETGDRTDTAAAVVAAVLALDGLCHLYWATGAVWPAGDAQSLSRAVLGFEASFGPAVVLPLAIVLFGAALTVLGRARLGRGSRFGVLLHTGTLVLGGALTMRALAGVVWSLGIGVEVGAPFYWLNLFIYTPVCIGLAAATGVVARSVVPHLEFSSPSTVEA
jgi:4,5:9,10-diseco-3-hydroxy-5,9,17-trioxoandrosta-1(10),2-diene-4-oate hydrolase